MEEQKVKNAMNTTTSIIHVNESIDYGIMLMERNNFTHLLVEDDNTICGIVSKSDILTRLKSVAYTTGGRTYNQKFLKGLKIWECMSSSPDCVKENDDLSTAAQLMIEKKHHVLPVLNDSGKISGTISSLDVLKNIFITI